jgi:hypothetical protein
MCGVNSLHPLLTYNKKADKKLLRLVYPEGNIQNDNVFI